MYRKQLQSKIRSYCYNTYNYVAIAIMITEATQTHVIKIVYAKTIATSYRHAQYQYYTGMKSHYIKAMITCNYDNTLCYMEGYF